MPRSSRRCLWRRRSTQVAGYAATLLSLAAVHGIRYYNEPQLAAGSRAPQTLIAPDDAVVEDPAATEMRRAQVRSEAPRALQINPVTNQMMQSDLTQRWQELAQIRQVSGSLPYLPLNTFPLPEQIHLRKLSPLEWQTLLTQVEQSLPSPAVTPAPPLQNSWSTLQPSEASSRPPTSPYGQSRRALIQAWQSVQSDLSSSAGSNPPSDRYATWVAEIEAAQQRYQLASQQLQTSFPDYSPLLLDLMEDEWSSFQAIGIQALSRLQAIGIAPGLPSTVRLQGIQAQVSDLQLTPMHSQPAQAEVKATLIQILADVLQPNLEVDLVRTKAQIESMVNALEPVVLLVDRGEILVRAGQEISPETFLILDHFDLTQRGINIWGLLGVTGLMGLGLVIFIPLQRRFCPELRTPDRILILFLVLTVAPLASAFGVQFSSLPAVGLLLSSFYGTQLGLLIVAAEALVLPLVTPVSVTTLVPLVAGSLVACLGARRLRSREELAFLGGGAALTQMVFQAALSLATGGGLNLASIARAGSTGLGWSIIALGASPYLERLFDLVTPVRLLELANPNRPLLRRLATEAPGSFQHTLFVTTLAERAAQRLNLNAELVRTGTLYHDIGKMVHAQYFIENQMGGVNPHNELDDPYRSAEIIKAHISDGLKLARQYRLPTAIRAFIPEHQGTIRIAYFYHQAQQKTPGQPIPEAAFRYDGPIPQTPETGVVMLADACEAALRSMKTDCYSPEVLKEARDMVQRIFKTRWEDQQLVDSGLTCADLEIVADAFLEVWQQSNHERIPYPKAALQETEEEVSTADPPLNNTEPSSPLPFQPQLR